MPLLILIGDNIMILDYIQVHFVPKNNSVREREINHNYAHRGIFFIIVARYLPHKHHVIYQPTKLANDDVSFYVVAQFTHSLPTAKFN